MQSCTTGRDCQGSESKRKREKDLRRSTEACPLGVRESRLRRASDGGGSKRTASSQARTGSLAPNAAFTQSNRRAEITVDSVARRSLPILVTVASGEWAKARLGVATRENKRKHPRRTHLATASHSENKKNVHHSITQRQRSSEEGQNLGQTLYKTVNKRAKSCSASLVTRKMRAKTKTRHRHTPPERLPFKRPTASNTGEAVEQLELSSSAEVDIE